MRAGGIGRITAIQPSCSASVVTSRMTGRKTQHHFALRIAMIITAFALAGLLTTVLLSALAVLNGILALLATISVWKAYLVIGTKVLLTVLICIPVVGILIYLFWGQRKVREAH